MSRDVVRHAFGFLSVAGLWNARLVCRQWRSWVSGCPVHERVCLQDLARLPPDASLAVHSLTVVDGGRKRTTLSASVLQIRARILTLQFKKLRSNTTATFGSILEKAVVTDELRFSFSALDECCGEGVCAGQLCMLLRSYLHRFEGCLVEIPWRFQGYLSPTWCFPEQLLAFQRSWRLRGCKQRKAGELTLRRFFNPYHVFRLVLEDIEFHFVCSGELGRLHEAHVNLSSLEFVNCSFPPVPVWGEWFGQAFPSLFERYEVSFEKCTIGNGKLDFQEVLQAYPGAEFRVRQ